MISISTKTGDKGESGLANGVRVSKGTLVFDVLGTLDELNSWIGLSLTTLEQQYDTERVFLLQIQDTLFYIGAEIADSPKAELDPQRLEILEQQSDALQQAMEEKWYTKFLLPGGTPAAAHLDVTRCVCRRLERLMVQLNDSHAIRPVLLQYINRLSDYFYIVRCYINLKEDYSEHIFDPSYKPFFK